MRNTVRTVLGPEPVLEPKDAPAVVTGGSRGIGGHVARMLAAAGHPVTISYRNDEADAQRCARRITDDGGRCLSVRADVADSGAVDEIFTRAEAAHGPTAVLVNCAGMLADALLVDMEREQWDRIMEVNLTGPFLCTRRAAPAMIRARWGRIVNVSSIGSLIGPPGQANYAASKAGLLGFTRSVASELARWRITCNAVLPGPVLTRIIDHLSDKRREQLRKQIPAGRFGSAQEIASVIAFLCAAQASYVTGAVIPVDGGASMGC